jgi:hypothetical protein
MNISEHLFDPKLKIYTKQSQSHMYKTYFSKNAKEIVFEDSITLL